MSKEFVADVVIYPPEMDPATIEATLKVGDTLKCGPLQVKIAKIVPPGPLDPQQPERDVLVGWIELEPTPLLEMSNSNTK
jgi:hypothetical protein